MLAIQNIEKRPKARIWMSQELVSPRSTTLTPHSDLFLTLAFISVLPIGGKGDTANYINFLILIKHIFSATELNQLVVNFVLPVLSK